jgi:ABC-type Fe3+ transport system substrate-binding protein
MRYSNAMWIGALVPMILVAGLAGCRDEEVPAASDAPPMDQLVVISPHGPAIRDAFADQFSLWYDRKYGRAVSVRWIQKGTGECQQHIYEGYTRYPESMQIGVDVFFGGGVAVHRDIARKGYAQPIEMPEEIVQAIPASLNGQALRAEDGSWWGTALNGFGILYNRRACEIRGIRVPQAWEDLTRDEYRGWVVAANPAASGSTVQCLIMALLRHGWDDGWGVVTGILANCNGLTPSSTQIAPSVRSALAVAGLEPEFVARMAVAGWPDRLAYVNPQGATAITPDPITVLKGTTHLEAARSFVEFVLSEEGQALWAVQPDPEAALYKPLYRYPIRPDVYETYKGNLVIEGNPFTQEMGMAVDRAKLEAYTALLPTLLSAACGENHLLLQQAWRTAQDKGPDAPELVVLKTPPFDEETALRYAAEISKDPARAGDLAQEWSEKFRLKYTGGSVPATAVAGQ